MTYCGKCRHRLPYVPELDGYKRTSESEPDNGRDICSSGMKIVKNAIGEERYQLYGAQERCGECGTILYERQSIRYKKCEDKNIERNCKDFDSLSDLEVFQVKARTAWERVKDFLQGYRKYRIGMFALWGLAHVLIISNKYSGGMAYKAYIGLTVLFFIYYITENS